MAQPGTQPAALAFLPQWWQETTDAAVFDPMLLSWVRVCGYRSAGFIWPAEGAPSIAKSVPAHAGAEPVSPLDLQDIARQLRAGEPTCVVSLPSGASRVYAPVACPGRPLAILWADLPAGQAWSESDKAYVALVGRTLERSPVVAALLGPAMDADRLTQRLADAATVAGRMAHDFDNILTGILGFADLALPLVPPGSQEASYIAEIAKVGQRGTIFTQQLHGFNRGGESRPTPGSVAATLGREDQRLRPIMHAALKVEKDIPASLPAVAIDAGPLQQALGHLFENAVEACPKGGIVRVSVQQVELSETESRSYLGKVSPGQHLQITFADSGPGIKPEHRKRMFVEPFFTTKLRHRGLGLATVYRILAAHRGGVLLENAALPGMGAVIRVVFPLALPRPSISAPTPPPALTGLREEAARSGSFLNSKATARG